MTAAVAVASPSRPVVARSTGPSLPALVAWEVRKSLSTRSGVALAAVAALLAPAGTLLAASTAQGPLDSVVGPLALVGMLTAYVLVSLGVLSTAGEWSHGSVRTTYLLVPLRSRVLAAKAVAVAAIGLVLSAVATAGASGVLALTEPSAAWTGAWRVAVTVVAAGAAFGVVGAGIGAALGNTPAALTGIYLVVLGIMPVLETVKPSLAQKVDPANAVLELSRAHAQTQSLLVLGGWVLVSVVAGVVMTRRRAVQ